VSFVGLICKHYSILQTESHPGSLTISYLLCNLLINAVITILRHILTQMFPRHPQTLIQTRFLLCIPWRKMKKWTP